MDEPIVIPCNDEEALRAAFAEDPDAIVTIHHVCMQPLHHAINMDERMSIEDPD